MPKKYIVRLTAEERDHCHDTINRLSGSSKKVKRAYILLACDVNGLGLTDKEIAQSYHCWVRTVERLRRRLVEDGFLECLNGKSRMYAPRALLLDGKQQAQLIAMRLGQVPEGYGSWTLRLLARKFVERGFADSVSHETCRGVLKKTA